MEEKTARKKAEENLEEAIKNLLEVYDHNDGLLIEWFLITAHHIADDEGTATACGTYGPEHQRLYSAAGLLRYATQKIDDRISQ